MSRLFVFGSFPPLEWGSKPDITSEMLRELFEDNLRPGELKEIHVLQLWIDLCNIQAALEGSDFFDPRGNFSQDTLERLLHEGDLLPDYVYSFLADYPTDEERKRNFPALIASYFASEKKKATGFVRQFLEFEQALRILVTGFRAKRLGRDVVRELQFEDPSDPFVQTVLVQKNTSGSFVFPFEFQELQEKLEQAGRDPLLQYETIMQFRFAHYSQEALEDPLALKALAAHMMRLWILEDYFALRQEKGEEIVSQVVEEGL